MQKIKIWFFGTPELSRRVLLDILSDSRFEVMFVVSNPDKPFGRKQVLTPSPVKSLSESKNIPVFTPSKIRGNEKFLNTIKNFWCDYFVVVAYGKILPKEILEMPKKMCINVHGSLLPKYRGASPIQSALLFGEKTTGVTIMQMSEKMDEWAMILKKEIVIDDNETTETLFEKFGEISGKTLCEAIIKLDNWEISPIEQNHAEATYCGKINKEDGFIDWNLDAEKIFWKWQAFTPWPGIFTNFKGKRLLLEKISFSSETISLSPWIVRIDENKKIFITTKNGKIFPEIVKLEGKKSQNISDFINGNPDFINNIL